MAPQHYNNLIILSYDSEDELPAVLDLRKSQIESVSFDEDDDDNIEEYNSSSQTRDESRKSIVSFSESLDVFEVVTAAVEIKDDNDLQPQQFWYKKDEMQDFRLQRRIKSSHLEAVGDTAPIDGDDEDEEKDCIEGLEPRQSSKPVIEAVLNEQGLQNWNRSSPDPESLSRISRQLSDSSVEEALHRGLRLQNDICSTKNR